MTDKLNSINSSETTNTNKYNKFVKNTKEAVRKVLMGTGIVISTLLPITSAELLTACSDGGDATEVVKDTTPPTINLLSSSIDITGGKEVRISGNQLYIGSTPIASRSDETTKNCKVELSINGKPVTSGTTISEEGTLTIKVTDAAGNTKNASLTLNINNAPEITVDKYEINIFGGAKINISDNKLMIGDETVASRKDESGKKLTVSLSFNGQPVKSGDTIDGAGKLSITITNEKGKSSSTEITVTNDAIYGLETLKNASLKVDQEINLLNGISFANGVELVKTEIEIDGKRSTITDPSHYTPSYPGVCSIIFSLQGKNGETTEIKVDNLTIKPLDYKEATINNANMIQEKYPWYNNLKQSTKNFIYPHLIASYAACNRSKQNNRAHIIMGETTDADDVENIGQFPTPSEHAYEGYYRIRALSPDTPIKGCKDYWENLESYINQHPNDFFLISCAVDILGGESWEELKNDPEVAPLRRILQKENVIVIAANGNGGSENSWRNYNEDVKNGTNYNSSSINSNLNNKITVTGYNSGGNDNYFSPDYSIYGGLKSSMPVGYKKEKGNIVMPMIPLISSNNQESSNTASSYPTAVVSGVVGNAISIVISNRPGITAEDAMTVIANNYLSKEKFQYKDKTTNRQLVDGDYRYFIDMNKLLKTELLQSAKIDNLQFNSALVSLPSGPGICYTGKGIQFEFEGKKYNTTTANQSILNQALKSGNIKWYWHRDTFKKYGGTNSASFDVYVVDKSGKKIPDTHLSITKSVN